MPSWMFLGFQDSCSFLMNEFFFFHDHLFVIMIGVVVMVLYMMFLLFLKVGYYKNFFENTFLEVVWSVIPFFFIVFLIFPSLKVLYQMEDVKYSDFNFKVMGHQWYWSYAVPLYKNFFFKVFSNHDSECEFGYNFYKFDSFLDFDEYPRLLMTNKSLVLPFNVNSRLLISSYDVIHSFSVPALGLKVDAIPGRINQLYVFPNRLGVFFGQCSEICGSNHSFMPISVKVLDMENYEDYTKMITLEGFSENF